MNETIGFDTQGNALHTKSVTKWLILNGNTFVWLNKEVRPYKIPGDHHAKLRPAGVLRETPFGARIAQGMAPELSLRDLGGQDE